MESRDQEPGPPPTREGVEVLAEETVYRGYFRVVRYRLRHVLHAGGWSAAVDREVLERGHAAALLPYDPVRDEVVLVQQFRAGAFAAGRGPWLNEVIAGIIEPGEEAEAVAIRESREEAGLEVTAVAPIYEFLVSPGGTSHTVALYCGRVDTARAGGIFGLDHEHEDIRAVVHPFDRAMELVETGGVEDSATLIALLWLRLNRERLREEWRP